MLRVKVIDENHEKDLERNINNFLMNENYDIIDIQFRTAVSIFSEEQIYCFSAMILYKDKE
ncbi:MAG: sporulation protein Cse60 [Bacilli bacterium]|nr:sporulation protein Cse60 [Bacilli bacterium]